MKFKWETQIEYEFREGVNKLADEVGKILLGTKKIADLNYEVTYDELSKKVNQLKRMAVPICYDNIYKLLMEGYGYYLKGYGLLIKSEINDIITTKAAMFINCANSYVKIATCKNLELLEMRQLHFEDVEKMRQLNGVGLENEPR